MLKRGVIKAACSFQTEGMAKAIRSRKVGPNKKAEALPPL